VIPVAHSLAYDVYVRLLNFLLRLPGHLLRRLVLAELVRADVADDVSLERGVRVTGKGGVSIGAGSNINTGVLLDGRGGLSIGANVNISPEAFILTAEHDPKSPDFAGVESGVVIGDRVWIAARAMVLPGSRVGEGAVVGAGAVVRGAVEPWSIVIGNPARKVGDRPADAQSRLEPYRRWLH
jgi:acetyltransferase-like isoleucine patch superfamily enzyme